MDSYAGGISSPGVNTGDSMPHIIEVAPLELCYEYCVMNVLPV
jgi:hypothetical protein